MYQPGQFQVSRCQFAMAGITVGAAHFAPQQLLGKEQSSFEISATATHPTIQPGLNASFAPLNQIDAGLLNVGYAESGPRNGTAVVLLHGWPYDIYSYARSSKDFPHESTVDQWFSESQFESYRALGSHILEQLGDPLADASFEEFLTTARAHIEIARRHIAETKP